MSSNQKNMNASVKNDLIEIKRRAVNLFISMKLQFLSASIIPVLLGTAFFFTRRTGINWTNFILALLGICFLHLSANMFNDYFDYINGTDQKNTEFIRPFTGGSRVIQDGIMNPYQILVWALAFLTAGSVTGFFLVLRTGPGLLFIGLIGVISVLFYVNKSFSLISSGFGEFTIFLNFGPLPILGSYYIQAKTIPLNVLLISIPVGLLITAVLYINQFPDYKADKECGKNNLVVRLGRKKARWGYVALLISAYVLLFFLIAVKIVPLPGTVIFLTLPLAILSCTLILKYYENSPKLVPALPSTILLHLGIGYFLVISLLYGKGLEPFTHILLSAGLIYFAVNTYSMFKFAGNSGTHKEAKNV
ncbi:MAG: 1,4-dihydroxy-2-naphthoate octaprenyltransferase [Spirochaetes bacterium]|nr:1,4-dihydroxy-2-naphthoate octaprenyltransferase [Spirochaetota bacterium]